MKNFASPLFYRTFDLLLGTINPGAKVSYWAYDGVEWVRDRYSITGRTHGIIIEIFTLTRPGRCGWSVMVTNEHWWAGTETVPIKNSRWARPTSGRRSDLMKWFREQELELDRGSQAISRTHRVPPRSVRPATGPRSDKKIGLELSHRPRFV